MDEAVRMRGALVRGVVLGVQDAAAVQRLTVETHDGVVRDAVEVAMPYGLASHPPAGAIAVLVAIGGDQGDLLALPAAAPGAGRLAGLAPGEVAIHDAAGNRVHIRAGGVIEVHAATRVVVHAPRVEIVAAEGVAITGDLTVSGDVSDLNGSMQEMRARYNGHRHGGGAAPSPIMD